MKMCPCILSFMLSFSSTTKSYAVNLTVMLLSVYHLPKVIHCESVGLNQFISDFILVGDDGFKSTRITFLQDQSHCTKTGYNTVEDRAKPLLLKELKYIWEKHEPDLPWASGEYNESNTLLLDDSPYKALRNPVSYSEFLLSSSSRTTLF